MEPLVRRIYLVMVGLSAVFAVCGILIGIVLPSTSGAPVVAPELRVALDAALVTALTLLILWRANPKRRRVLLTAFIAMASSAALYGAEGDQAIASRLALLLATVGLLAMCVLITAIWADRPHQPRLARR